MKPTVLFTAAALVALSLAACQKKEEAAGQPQPPRRTRHKRPGVRAPRRLRLPQQPRTPAPSKPRLQLRPQPPRPTPTAQNPPKR